MRGRVGLLVVGVMLTTHLGSVAVAADGYRGDPYHLMSLSQGGSSATKTVPRARLRERCGDGDGCTVRLLQESENESAGTDATRYRGWFFATDSTGRDWSFDNTDGTYTEGSIDDGATGIMVQVSSGLGFCYFSESGPAPSTYVLTATVQTGPETTQCTLRIDD